MCSARELRASEREVRAHHLHHRAPARPLLPLQLVVLAAELHIGLVLERRDEAVLRLVALRRGAGVEQRANLAMGGTVTFMPLVYFIRDSLYKQAYENGLTAHG